MYIFIISRDLQKYYLIFLAILKVCSCRVVNSAFYNALILTASYGINMFNLFGFLNGSGEKCEGGHSCGHKGF